MARFGRKAPAPETAPERTPEVPAAWGARLAPEAPEHAAELPPEVEAETRAAYQGGRTFPTHDDEW